MNIERRKSDIPERDLFQTEREYKFFSDVFLSLQARGQNFESVLPTMRAYAQQLDLYFTIFEQIGNNFTVETERGAIKKNPLLSIANDCLSNIRLLSKALKIDPLSRGKQDIKPHELPENGNGQNGKFLKRL